MREAAAGERHHLRLLAAPSVEGARPFLRSARVERLFAAGDHAAVDDARHDRRHLAGGHADHRLVEKPQSLVDSPLLDPDQPLEVHRCGEEVRVPEALGNVDDGARGGEGRVVVARGFLLEPERHEQVSPLHGVTSFAFDQTLPSTEPAARGTDLAADREVHADPERRARRPKRFAPVEVDVVRPLQEREVVVHPADH
jgi:hypothetical protein